MSDEEYSKYKDKKFNEIPKLFLEQCVAFLQYVMPEETKNEIREAYKEKGDDWIGIGHFHFGMFVRNKLREAGFTDDNLPDKNWDDYYLQVLEAAAGLREFN